jgi:hypothetical protein
LCPVEIVAAVGKLVEEVTDEPLGALIQVLEVGRELNSGVSAEMKEWSDADLRCSIDKKEKHLTRGEDREAEERRRNPRWHACCWPFARGEERKLGFLGEA